MVRSLKKSQLQEAKDSRYWCFLWRNTKLRHYNNNNYNTTLQKKIVQNQPTDTQW